MDGNAKVVVLGDLNDFEFSTPLNTLKSGILSNLMETLPQNERYSYVYEGNSQALDHILVSTNLFNLPYVYDIVHVNSEFATRASDHDPQVTRINLSGATAVTLSRFDAHSNAADASIAFWLMGGVGSLILLLGWQWHRTQARRE